jgi:hypothetical protein
MLEQLRRMQALLAFELEVVDVDGDASLESRYGELVPVLLDGEWEICHYHLDRKALETYLTERTAPRAVALPDGRNGEES